MKSIFGPSFFGSRGLPGFELGGVRLAQTPPSTPAATDQSGTAPASGTSSTASGIEDLLKQLQGDALGTYSAKYQACQNQITNGGAVGLVTGAKCLDDLYNEIRNYIKNGPPKTAAAPAPVASEFPVLPVVVGGLGLIVLIWGLSKL